MLALEWDWLCSDPSSPNLLEPQFTLLQDGDADSSGHSPTRALGGTEMMGIGTWLVVNGP